ncbi:uncharacterized protein LOC125370307 [Ricinus communis]|uniref:uncharacterized protein LOC125370307 n=1 Tax=Ricinus communis TaxID=3988 RepID=UPI00201A3F7B|nr:uncharacterized protein LOC125370307 [Ricinus communis]
MEGKEKKKSKREGAADNLELWPDLPQQLIYLIAKNPSLMAHICSKVTKSWRAEASKCRSIPATHLARDILLYIFRYGSDYKQSHIFNLPTRRGFIWYQKRRKPPPLAYHFIGCTHGVLVEKGYTLWDPVMEGHWCIPSWDARFPFLCAASSSRLQEHYFWVLIVVCLSPQAELDAGEIVFILVVEVFMVGGFMKWIHAPCLTLNISHIWVNQQ